MAKNLMCFWKQAREGNRKKKGLLRLMHKTNLKVKAVNIQFTFDSFSSEAPTDIPTQSFSHEKLKTTPQCPIYEFLDDVASGSGESCTKQRFKNYITNEVIVRPEKG